MNSNLNNGLIRFSVYFTASVWLINGLLCKVLGLVPRHEQIVSRILGSDHAHIITRVIGSAEIAMAVWILLRIRPRWSALAQIGIVATMNILEFTLAPDLLLFGRMNIVVATLYIAFVSYTERLRKRTVEVAVA